MRSLRKRDGGMYAESVFIRQELRRCRAGVRLTRIKKFAAVSGEFFSCLVSNETIEADHLIFGQEIIYDPIHILECTITGKWEYLLTDAKHLPDIGQFAVLAHRGRSF